jgi:hypothetical protein
MRKYFTSTEPSIIGDNAVIACYEQQHSTTLPAISLVEWEFTHNDFKGVTCGVNPELPKGIPTVMDYDNGTVLVLVRVVRTDESVVEKSASIAEQISSLLADLAWAEQHKTDPTFGYYKQDVEGKIADLNATLARIQKMGKL